jgi:hypothetical protein
MRRQAKERLRREREQARRAEVRHQATQLLTRAQSVSAGVDHHLAQHFGREALKQAALLSQDSQRLLSADPDKALQLARRSIAAAERAAAEASAKLAAWTQSKVEAQEKLTVLRLSLEGLAERGCIKGSVDPRLALAARCLVEATSAMRREAFSAASAAAGDGQKAMEEAEEARRHQEEREAIRKEIVRSLRRVLGQMGFSVAPPRLVPGADAGKVVLTGILPSGRQATFEITLDGQVCYDFAGYSHRQCGADEEAIRKQIEALCNASATEQTKHFKDEAPLRIDRNAHDLPESGRRHMSS